MTEIELEEMSRGELYSLLKRVIIVQTMLDTLSPEKIAELYDIEMKRRGAAFIEVNDPPVEVKVMRFKKLFNVHDMFWAFLPEMDGTEVSKWLQEQDPDRLEERRSAWGMM